MADLRFSADAHRRDGKRFVVRADVLTGMSGTRAHFTKRKRREDFHLPALIL